MGDRPICKQFGGWRASLDDLGEALIREQLSIHGTSTATSSSASSARSNSSALSPRARTRIPTTSSPASSSQPSGSGCVLDESAASEPPFLSIPDRLKASDDGQATRRIMATTSSGLCRVVPTDPSPLWTGSHTSGRATSERINSGAIIWTFETAIWKGGQTSDPRSAAVSPECLHAPIWIPSTRSGYFVDNRDIEFCCQVNFINIFRKVIILIYKLL